MAKKSKKTPKSIFRRVLYFTEKVFYILVICYLIWQFSALAVIIWGVRTTLQFSFLDTFISETNETFRTVAGVIITKFLVENIFKFNEFSFMKHKNEDNQYDKGTDYSEADQSEVLDGSGSFSGIDLHDDQGSTDG